ncbi:MFS transporter [Rubellimicrobium aerolatum]|uniref:MFS transporter n=1 Tax=Rubellimicrobium aerolatum TaxID=490979 RepID=A0ABW0S815_9RHOB|nr:MFS transporter [Rubellimicrobium aerolatum]MBP1804392.1 EmrB/QacA subfamily drug resistance transporter [Rubellimicrobium aerolatum]
MILPDSAALTPVRKQAILAIVLLSYVLIVLDISIVITGLEKLQAELGFSEVGLSWVSSIYTLAFGSVLLLGARAGDMHGRRRMFLLGLGLFTLASLAIGLAASPEWVIAGRAIQGLGAAVLAPSTLALLQTTFAPGPERTKALAYYAAAAGVSASVGLVLGGILADWVSWRAGFLMNVPLGLGLLIAARRCIDESARLGGRMDWAGVVMSTLGMGALVHGVVRSATAGWSDPLTLASLVIGVTALALFVRIERRAAPPLMPLRLFASRERSGAYAARLLFLGANVGFYFFISQFFQQVMGLSAAGAGLAFLPATLVNFAAALAVPRLASRFGSGPVLIASLGASALGFLGLARGVSSQADLFGLAVPMMLVGLGQGGALAPLTQSGVAGVTPDETGAASGVVNAAHQLGSSLGLAVLVAVAAAAGTGPAAGALQSGQISAALWAGLGLVVAALVLSWALILPAAPKARPAPFPAS